MAIVYTTQRLSREKDLREECQSKRDKRIKNSRDHRVDPLRPPSISPSTSMTEEPEDTETKLAIISSIFISARQEALLDVLIRAEGDINRAIDLHLSSAADAPQAARPPKRALQDGASSPNKRPSQGAEVGSRPLSSVLKWTASAEPARKVFPPAVGADGRLNMPLFIFINLSKSPS